MVLPLRLVKDDNVHIHTEITSWSMPEERVKCFLTSFSKFQRWCMCMWYRRWLIALKYLSQLSYVIWISEGFPIKSLWMVDVNICSGFWNLRREKCQWGKMLYIAPEVKIGSRIFKALCLTPTDLKFWGFAINCSVCFWQNKSWVYSKKLHWGREVKTTKWKGIYLIPTAACEKLL